MIRKLWNFIKKKLMTKEQYVDYLRMRGVNIGTGCEIDKTAYFETEPWLITIGNNVRITRNVQFITHDGGLWTLRKIGLINSQDCKYGNISIGNNSNISWNVTIMPNVHIGNNCVIAAGAVVTTDIPDGTIWGGVPARQIETIEEYCEKIQDDLVPTYSMQECEKRDFLKKNKPELFLFR